MTPMPDINEPTEAEIEAAERALHSSTPNGNTGLLTRHGVRKALLAARRVSSAPSFVDVPVKLLEWRPEPPYHVARALGGHYAIEVVDGRSELSGTFLRRDFPSFAGAKAGAQADYEQRIRSALDIVPAPSFADGIEAAKVAIELGTAPLEGANIRIGIGNAIAAAIRALAHNPQASSGGDTRQQDIRDALGAMIDWVGAALNCADWHWDGDQRAAAQYEMERAKSALASASSRPTHRHKKRRTEYVLIGYGRMQADNWIDKRTGKSVDMEEVAMYRSVDDGSLWPRPREEFEDGRFEVLK